MKSTFLKLGPGYFGRVLVILSLAFGAHAVTAPSYDNDAQTWKFAAPGSGVSLTFTTGAGSNQVLFVAIRAESPLFATMTYGAQNMTLLRRDASASSDELSIFYLVAPLGGLTTLNVSISPSYAAGAASVTIFSYSNVDQAVPFGSITNVTGSPAGPPWSLSLAITPTDTGSTVLEISDIDSQGGACMPTSFTPTFGIQRHFDARSLINPGAIAVADYGYNSTAASSFAHAYGAASPCGSGIVVTGIELLPLGCYSPYLVSGSEFSQANNSNNLNISYTRGSGSNTLLLVNLSVDVGASVTGISYNGAPLARILKSAGSNANNMESWYLTNPASGSNTLSFAWGGSFYNYAVLVKTYANVDTSNPIGVSVSAGNLSSVSSYSSPITTLYARSLVDDFLTVGTGGFPGWNLGAGQDFENQISGSPAPVYSDNLVAMSPGSTTLTYSAFGYAVDVFSQTIEIRAAACVNASPTPTPTPSASPSRTRSPSPTWSPSVSPSRTPSPSPTWTPSATPTYACAAVQNSGMETADGGGPFSDATAYGNWFYSFSGCASGSRTAAFSHSGSNSLLGFSNCPGGQGAYWVQNLCGLSPNCSYQLCAWVRTDTSSPSSSIYIALEPKTSAGSNSAVPLSDYNISDANGAWKQHCVTIIPGQFGASFDHLRLVLGNEGDGAGPDNAYFDDVTFTQLSCGTVTATPSPTPSWTPSPSPTPTNTSSPTWSRTGSPTPSPTVTPTASPTWTRTASPTVSPSPSGTPTVSPSSTPTASPTASPSCSPSPSATASNTPSPTITRTPSGSVLLVASANPASDPGDLLFIYRLENIFNLAVVTVTDVAALASDAAGKAMVFISASVNSATVGSTFTSVNVPLGTNENRLQDDLLFTGPLLDVDYGVTLTAQTQMDATLPAHYIDGGLSGALNYLNPGGGLGWGQPGNQAAVLAQSLSDPTQKTLYAYDKGALLYGGIQAPARRLFFPAIQGALENLDNPVGLALFDRSIQWLLGAAPTSPTPTWTLSSSPSPTSSPSPSITMTATPSPSPTISPSPTPTLTATSSATGTASPSRSPTQTSTPSSSPTSTATPTATGSASPTVTVTTTPLCAFIDGAAAVFIEGQNNAVSSQANQGGSAGQGTLNDPWGVFSDGVHLIVADRANNRVLIYNSIPSGFGATADVVVGQPDFVSSLSGTTAVNLASPSDVFYDGTKLYVADTGNSRVLIYNSLPTVNGAAANVAVGQPDLISGSTNQGAGLVCAANTLSNPQGVVVSGGKLMVADTTNNRVLVYNSVPAASNASANLAIGQADFLGHNAATTQSGLSSPRRMAAWAGKLVIMDSGNNRALIYGALPGASGALASNVLGQANFTSGGALPAVANTLLGARGVAIDGGMLAIDDTSNNRVLIFNTFPLADNVPADHVLGQADFSSVLANRGGTANGNTLNNPRGMALWQGRLTVADSNNNRLSVFLCGTAPTPTATPTATSTATPTWSPSITKTGTSTLSPSATPSASPTWTRTISPSATPTASPTATPTSSPSATASVSPTWTPTSSPSSTPSASPSSTTTASPTGTPSWTPTPSPTWTETRTPTWTATVTPSSTPTSTPSFSPTISPTFSASPSDTPGPTQTFTHSPTRTLSASPSATPTASPSATATYTPSASPTTTPTASSTATPSHTPSASLTPSPTSSPTASPTTTGTHTRTATATPSLTSSATPTFSFTVTVSSSATQSSTPSSSPSPSPSATTSATSSATSTASSTPSSTPSFSASVTSSATRSATPSSTPSRTESATPTVSFSASVTLTQTPSLTWTPSLTITATPSVTLSHTATQTFTDSPTPGTPTPAPSFHVTIRILDASGAVLRTFSAPSSDHAIQSPLAGAAFFNPFKETLAVSDGTWAIAFDGKDGQGSNLGNGIYLMEIRSQQNSSTTVASLMFTVLSDASPIQSLQVAPNPALPGQKSVSIAWLPFSAAEIRIYGSAGDLIRSYGSTTPPLVWDLKTASGENASSGVYIVAIRLPGERHSKVFKLAVVR